MPSVFNCKRSPSVHCTPLTDNRRVCSSMFASKACSGSSVERISTSLISTPRRCKASQGKRLDGNSSTGITRLSPGRQSMPFATVQIPSVVFFKRAISSAETALINLAIFCRSCFSRSNQWLYCSGPSLLFSWAKSATACDATRGHGAMAAWFAYRPCRKTGNWSMGSIMLVMGTVVLVFIPI